MLENPVDQELAQVSAENLQVWVPVYVWGPSRQRKAKEAKLSGCLAAFAVFCTRALCYLPTISHRREVIVMVVGQFS